MLEGVILALGDCGIGRRGEDGWGGLGRVCGGVRVYAGAMGEGGVKIGDGSAIGEGGLGCS